MSLPGAAAEKRFELIIFDCDSVLVDSELIANRVFVQMLNDLRLSLSLEDMFEQLVGRSMPQCLEVIAGLLGRPVSGAHHTFERMSDLPPLLVSRD